MYNTIITCGVGIFSNYILISPNPDRTNFCKIPGQLDKQVSFFHNTQYCQNCDTCLHKTVFTFKQNRFRYSVPITSFIQSGILLVLLNNL